MGRFDAGETIEITIRRDGEPKPFDVTLAESIPPLQPQRLGLTVSEQQVGDETTVFVDAVLADGPASEQLQAGDQIEKVGAVEIDSVNAIRRQLVSAIPGEPLELTISRKGAEQQVSIVPGDVAGTISDQLPESWRSDGSDSWQAEAFALPDVSNKAVLVAPAEGDPADRLGLLVLLLNPGEGSPEEVAKRWLEPAEAAGTAVLVVAPEDNRRWQPNEIDVVGRFASTVMNQVAVEPAAVAVAAPGALSGNKAEAADSMALAVAVGQSSRFFGVAVSEGARPPAVRVRENDAEASLQVLLPIDAEAELPGWAAPLVSGGYPIVRGGEVDRGKLLRWTRLLQSI